MNDTAELGLRRRRLRSAAALLLLLALAVLAFFRLGKPMLRLVSEPEFFRGWVQERGIWGRVAYVGMMMLQVIVAFIPGEPLEIAAGYAFGAVEGTLLCMGAATLGSLAVFFLVRRFGARLAELFFSKEKLRSLRFLQSSRRRNILFLIVFSIPGTPKDLLCYFAGLTDMKPGVWLLICSLGRIPSIVSSTVGGDALGSRSYLFAIAVFAAGLALSGAGLLAYRRIRQRHSTEKKESEDTAEPTEKGA